MEPSFRPIELSLPVPKHPHLNLHAHLSFMGNFAMVHLTTTELGEGDFTLPPMGSFVYAMPNVGICAFGRPNLPSLGVL
jgi:hypothetical protein